MKISVLGIGYVGAVTAACLADAGFHVVAVDNNPIRISNLKDGRAPIAEPGLDELIAKHTINRQLMAESDINTAIQHTDISLICVGTPSHNDGTLNLDYVEDVCSEIGEALRFKDSFHAIILRSTVLPGTSKNVAIPTLEKASGKKCGIGFGFGVNPEFLREGTAISDYRNPANIVIGANDDKTAKTIDYLYKDIITAPRSVVSLEVAEALKYVNNAWHAMKVGFANEIGNAISSLGVDSHQVMNVFFQDRQLNISPAYLMPGFAFGGSCLPKDIRAIRAASQEKDLNTPLLDGLLASNQQQIDKAVQMVRAFKAENITLLGLAFKMGTDDLRESPLLILAQRLLDLGANLRIYDSNVSRSLQNYGSSYAQHIPQNILESIVESPDFSNTDLFIIGHNNSAFIDILNKADPSIGIIDLVRPKGIGKIATRPHYQGICW